MELRFIDRKISKEMDPQRSFNVAFIKWCAHVYFKPVENIDLSIKYISSVISPVYANSSIRTDLGQYKHPFLTNASFNDDGTISFKKIHDSLSRVLKDKSHKVPVAFGGNKSNPLGAGAKQSKNDELDDYDAISSIMELFRYCLLRDGDASTIESRYDEIVEFFKERILLDENTGLQKAQIDTWNSILNMLNETSKNTDIRNLKPIDIPTTDSQSKTPSTPTPTPTSAINNQPRPLSTAATSTPIAPTAAEEALQNTQIAALRRKITSLNEQNAEVNRTLKVTKDTNKELQRVFGRILDVLTGVMGDLGQSNLSKTEIVGKYNPDIIELRTAIAGVV